MRVVVGLMALSNHARTRNPTSAAASAQFVFMETTDYHLHAGGDFIVALNKKRLAVGTRQHS